MAQFEPIEQLNRRRLLDEMDAAWDALGLDNTRPLADQLDGVGRFYSHPVWVLNGVYSAKDPVSLAHRLAIADWVQIQAVERVADYGGGSGVLAGLLANRLPTVSVEIVEPFPSSYFVARVEALGRVRYVPTLQGPYDLVIAQDVLEHVDAPVELALDLAKNVRDGGLAIFANAFWPEIKCHLPANFYLRHQFGLIMRAAGMCALGHVPGVRHALIFRRQGPLDRSAAFRADARAKWIGGPLNGAGQGLARTRLVLNSLVP
ncbi:MAG: methyltransferase domain-containing protein [Betaproteobacteria bacterium]|nr:methyltransferase domain-containing protein [Betaproteobacteria bacterium]